MVENEGDMVVVGVDRFFLHGHDVLMVGGGGAQKEVLVAFSNFGKFSHFFQTHTSCGFGGMHELCVARMMLK